MLLAPLKPDWWVLGGRGLSQAGCFQPVCYNKNVIKASHVVLIGFFHLFSPRLFSSSSGRTYIKMKRELLVLREQEVEGRPSLILAV